ncbi:hypothetical protein [Synechococcus sp. CCY 9618]|uniref:hypothetical protein n=1 Tax=Synechococcus sp. CCY 9618 TaxID=2815602 RepID=UPI001C21D41F|nr:hypothetical protein [Synechococcus sp. CCY 9618]
MVEAHDTNAVEPLRHQSCLGRTCMKWRDDGELSELDVELILQRLIAVDEQAGAHLG